MSIANIDEDNYFDNLIIVNTKNSIDVASKQDSDEAAQSKKRLQLSCSSEDIISWKHKALVSGLSLSEWISKTLNQEEI